MTGREPTMRFGFVLEQTLGHITHADNLSRLVPGHEGVAATFMPVPFDASGWPARIPGWGNWTVRAGLRARTAVRRAQRQGGGFDALFVHTQVPAVLMPDVIRRTPSIVSLDATPLQYDELGAQYGHEVGSSSAEGLKFRLNRACFHRAAHLVSWSAWTRDALVEQYGVDVERVSVIAPGVIPGPWERAADAPVDDDVVRILFVGGDLERKGGHHLIEATRAVRAVLRDGPRVELHLVTRAGVEPEPGVVVHHGMTPNSPDLIALYHRCHVFCLPTLGDCLPMVLSEAGAARLPLVSTDVGAIGEIVVDGETGFLVPTGDVEALARTLRLLVDEPDLRRRLGDRAHAHVRAHYDAAANAERILDVMRAVAVGGRRG
jgi:glycosyltransferase involved in cell wall biosynthesis